MASVTTAVKLRRIEGSGKVPPRLGLRPLRMSAELTRLELPIFDCRLLIDRGRKLPHDFFNRQSAIGNQNLGFGCGYAALR